MVVPSRIGVVEPPKSRAESYMLIIVKILFVLVILFMLPKLVDSGAASSRYRKQRQKILSQIRQVRNQICAKQVCSKYVPEESMNCVYACVSPACYNEYYGTEPLEDGEIDIARYISYDDCVQEEFKTLSHQKRTLALSGREA